MNLCLAKPLSKIYTICLLTDGTEFGRLRNGSSNLVICSKVNDKDIIFCGVDNSSDISALTLDMSDAGTALFNSKVTIGTTVPDKTLTVSGTITASTSISTPILSSTTLTVDGGVDISGNTIIGGSNFVSGDTHSDNIVLKANAGGTSFGQITPDVNHGTIKFMTKPPGTADNGESLTISQDLIEAKAAPGTGLPVSYMQLLPVDGGQDKITFSWETSN
mgnify:CR=1 FL=1